MGTTLEMLQWMTANGVTDKGFEELLGIVKNMLPERMNCPLQHTKQRRLFALLDWRYKKFTHILMIVFSIKVKNMRNWMLVLSVMQNGTRSGKMILVMSMGSPSRKKFLLR